MSAPRWTPPFQDFPPVHTVALRWHEHEEHRCPPQCWWCAYERQYVLGQIVNAYCDPIHERNHFPSDATSIEAQRAGF